MEHKQIKSENGNTHYWIAHNRSASTKCIVFTHGLTANHAMFEKQVERFSPVWFPDGQYTAYAECLDTWTPAGMLQINLTDDITIRDSLFSDWHIKPIK